ncbi:MAG: PAS domain-containing sensor histidine kinase, partial [Candidatus Thermoplasmatota archaeon]
FKMRKTPEIVKTLRKEEKVNDGNLKFSFKEKNVDNRKNSDKKKDCQRKDVELKKAMKRLEILRKDTEKARSELYQIFDSKIDGLLVIDKNHHIIRVNNKFTKIMGVKKSLALGKKCYEVFNTKNCDPSICPIKNILNGTKEHIEKERIIKNKSSGEKQYYLLTGIPFKSPTGEKIGAIESLRNITKIKKAEEKIRRKNKRLKKLDELKSAFLNVTSHELRTPISSIKGYVQMMIKQVLGKINGEQKKALEVVLRNTNRLDNLIRDILDISRLESGTMKFIPEETNIKEMIEEIMSTMKSSAEKKQIELIKYVEKDIPKIVLDQDRIKQVLINLINNAIKFSSENSKIKLSVKKKDKNIFFEVKDQGRGIPKNKKDEIFKTFYQVNSGMDRKFGGAGLGLAISRGIVIAHGGKIWVESEGEGKGSSFKFILPLKSVKNLEKRFKDVDVFNLGNKN